MKRILYLQYTQPAGYPSLEHSAALLADRGWEVLFLGIGAQGSDRMQMMPHPRVKVLKLPLCASGVGQKFHYAWFCLWAWSWMLLWRPRWLYVSDPLAAPAAVIIGYWPGLRIIYHEHDPVDAVGPKSRAMRWVGGFRSRLTRSAHTLILPNESRRALFLKEIDRPQDTLTVLNCPARKEAEVRRQPVETGRFRILYQGSIVPSRLPTALIDALAALPDRVQLRIIGYETIGSTGYVAQLLALARARGIDDRVEYLGVLPTRRELFEAARICDVGLSLMPIKTERLNEQTMAGASNKPFEYLACGLPLLVSDLPAWTELYVKPGYARSCDPDDPESITEQLRWFMDHPMERFQMGETGRQRILTCWNYEKVFQPVVDRMEALAHGV